jgi:hypothetical protein
LVPDLVVTGKDPSKTVSLNYIGLIAPTIKSVQELKADYDNLRAELNELREEVRGLKREGARR